MVAVSPSTNSLSAVISSAAVARSSLLAAAEAATRRQEQLTVEKERLYFEMKLAKHQLSKLQSQKDNYGDDRNDPRRRSENEDEEGEAAASCDSSSELNGLPLSTCGTHPELADADEAGTSTRDGNCEDCEDGCGNCERIHRRKQRYSSTQQPAAVVPEFV